MIAIILTALITFFVANLFGYFVHKSLHQKWAGRFYRAHRTHHFKLYPPSDFTSDKYRSAGKDNTLFIFGAAAIPIFLIPIILGAFHIVPLSIVFTSLLVMSIMSFLHSYLHDAFHINNHWLYKVPMINVLFTRWVYLHWLHHVEPQKNFGIFLFFMDKWFGTFWNCE